MPAGVGREGVGVDRRPVAGVVAAPAPVTTVPVFDQALLTYDDTRHTYNA